MPAAVGRFLEFFAGRIANARTRAAYGRAVGQISSGGARARAPAARRLPAPRGRLHPDAPPDRSRPLKQHLAATRMLGDWLVVNQVLPVNPAAAVRGSEARRHQGRDRPITGRPQPSTPYVEAAGREEPRATLFQSVDPTGRRVRGRALERPVGLTMIKRRAAAVGLPPSTCCHTFLATGGHP